MRSQVSILAICAIIVMVILIINVFTPQSKQESTINSTSVFDKTKGMILVGIICVFLPFVIIHLYAVNCMLEGECDKFVNVIVGVGIVLTIFYVIAYLVKIWKLKHKKV